MVKLWTIGYGRIQKDRFLELLKEHGIEVLCDVRTYPTSRVEHFKRENMEKWLKEAGISYVWMGDKLGGYSRTSLEAFELALNELINMASRHKVCLCCAEREPRRCHRYILSILLEDRGVKVFHIVSKGQKTLIDYLRNPSENS
ncbi:MAG: DUF488 domain-containing protein [Candidatus Nezhaarchaeales archaeon]